MLEERGYRRTWPPRMGDLSTRDVQMIELGEQAEAYIEHRSSQQQYRDTPSERHYNPTRSRSEWAEQFTSGDAGNPPGTTTP